MVNCVMRDDYVKVSSIDIPRNLIVSTCLRAISFEFKLKLTLADLGGYMSISKVIQ